MTTIHTVIAGYCSYPDSFSHFDLPSSISILRQGICPRYRQESNHPTTLTPHSNRRHSQQLELKLLIGQTIIVKQTDTCRLRNGPNLKSIGFCIRRKAKENLLELPSRFNVDRFQYHAFWMASPVDCLSVIDGAAK